MNVYDAVLKRRSIRKFKQKRIPLAILKELVNAARVAPQASNFQPMKYIIVEDEMLVKSVFTTISWAGYIRPAGNPNPGEEPAAYIVALCDKQIRSSGYDVDAGSAIENILLTAVEQEIGTCWLGAINKDKLRQILEIPDKYEIHTMVALGYPAETPIIEDEKGSIKYYKDENGVLHVPKRKLTDIMFVNKFE